MEAVETEVLDEGTEVAVLADVGLTGLTASHEATVAIYTEPGRADDILTKIRATVLNGAAVDLETKKGRGAVASRAWKVRLAKTALDDAGKTLTEDLRRRVGLVDAARRTLRDGCDEIATEVRAPLTEWEAAEEAREAEEARVAGVREEMEGWISNPRMSLDIIRAGFCLPPRAFVDGLRDGDLTDHRYRLEAALEACVAEDHGAARLEDELFGLRKEKAEREAAEAARLEAERKAAEAARRAAEKAEAAARAEQERVEREARIAAEAADKAKADAEAKSRLEAEEQEKARLDAEERARMAEEARIAEAAAARERERIAAELAEQQKAAAVRAERDRIEAERAAEEEADRIEREKAEKKAQTTRNRKRVEDKAITFLAEELDSAGIPDAEKIARAVVIKIAAGDVPGVAMVWGPIKGT